MSNKDMSESLDSGALAQASYAKHRHAAHMAEVLAGLEPSWYGPAYANKDKNPRNLAEMKALTAANLEAEYVTPTIRDGQMLMRVYGEDIIRHALDEYLDRQTIQRHDEAA